MDAKTFVEGTNIPAKLKEELSWLQKHERMIIVFLILFFGAIGFNAYLNGSAARSEAKTAALQLIVDNDKKTIDLLQSQNEKNAQAAAEVKAQYQQIVDTLERQNANLANAVATRNTQLQQTQAAIQTAPLDDVAKSIISSAKLNTGDLTVSGSTGILTQFGMRQVASELVRIPVLQDNLRDIQTVADNRQKELDKANDAIGAQNTQVAGLNTQILALNKLVVDGDKACTQKIDTVKKEARKSKRNWFLGGVLTGIGIGAKIASLVL